jgi:hypothetical protein
MSGCKCIAKEVFAFKYGGWWAKINEGRYQVFSGKGLPFLIICASQRSSAAKLLSRK